MSEQQTTISMEPMLQLFSLPLECVMPLDHVKYCIITFTALAHFFRVVCHVVEAMAKALQDKNEEGGDY